MSSPHTRKVSAKQASKKIGTHFATRLKADSCPPSSNNSPPAMRIWRAKAYKRSRTTQETIYRLYKAMPFRRRRMNVDMVECLREEKKLCDRGPKQCMTPCTTAAKHLLTRSSHWLTHFTHLGKYRICQRPVAIQPTQYMLREHHSEPHFKLFCFPRFWNSCY
jgi:hypothetical protein